MATSPSPPTKPNQSPTAPSRRVKSKEIGERHHHNPKRQETNQHWHPGITGASEHAARNDLKPIENLEDASHRDELRGDEQNSRLRRVERRQLFGHSDKCRARSAP